MAKGNELIDPLVAAIRRYVLANDKIHELIDAQCPQCGDA